MIISAGLLSFWWQEHKQAMYERSLMSSYDYDVELTTDSTLRNVTLYLPLPVINNTSSLGLDIIEHDFNADDDYPSLKYALVNTEHGLMLSMKYEKIEPRYDTSNKSRKIPYPSIILGTTVFSNQTIDTMNPLGNEMVLMPKYNLKYLGSTTRQNYLGSTTRQLNANVYNYDSRIYAHYETPSNANVRISIYLDARNQWWIGGWLSNNYMENIEIKLSGPQDEWTTVNGELVTREGTYEI
jgi:hypothetical protein